MTQNHLAALIAKKKAGEISPSELIELNALLKADADAQQTLDKVDAIWNVPLENAYVQEEYVTERWNALSNRLFETAVPEVLPRKRFGIVRKLVLYTAAAACLTAVVTGSIWLWNYYHCPAAPKQNIVSTKNGSKSKIELPDGTQVWLNSGSQLIYNDAYGKELREIHLSGEAFFDVAKDAEHPFIIHANELDIKVLGTAFNVRAYPDDKRTEAALIRGLIEVSFKGRPSDRLYLKPNEKISVMNGEMLKTEIQEKPEIAVTQAPLRSQEEPLISFSKVTGQSPADSTIPETAWIKNKLIFRNKSFEELAKDMERWYNVSFNCKDSALLQKHFTGSFYHETVSEALEILKLSYPFHYTLDKNKNTIVIE